MKVDGARSVQPTTTPTEAKTAQRPAENKPQNSPAEFQTKAHEMKFSGALIAASLQRRPPVGAGTVSSGSGTDTTYRVGEPARPPVQHDNGFLQNPLDRRDPKPQPTIAPTQADKDFYNSQNRNVDLAQTAISLGFGKDSSLPSWFPGSDTFEQNKHFLDSPDGLDAYEHFLEGGGTDRQFSYEKFVKDDPAGQVVLNSATADLQRGVEDMYSQMVARDPSLRDKPITFKVTGGAITVGDGTVADGAKFPYPDTDNWQKAIGGHTIWSSGTVTVRPPTAPGGKPQFSMNMTLHAEDRYNFNPKQADIETGAPDAVRGRLEQVGLAHQYMNYSTLDRSVSWQQGNINTPGGTTSTPPR